MSDEAIERYVTNPAKVETNSFYPFILYTKKYKQFDCELARADRDPKARKIRYACRRDAYIFEFYRAQISKNYETELVKRGIEHIPIAYRKLRTARGSGKSSIDFAKEAFEEIISRGSCIVVTLDISKYFENLDHAKIYQLWSQLLSQPKLPRDHLAVFKAITRYVEVDRDLAYERLGIIGALWGTSRKGFLRKRADIPTQLCTPKEFREKICGEGGKWPKLLQPNRYTFGIPQGAPISDLIANFYLLDFDAAVYDECKKFAGYYRRYCDDIILILPDDDVVWHHLDSFAKSQIKVAGAQLEIKDRKTRVHRVVSGQVTCVQSYESKIQPLEYLGFQFDGVSAKLRSGTMSSFYRKVTFAVRSEARHLVTRHPGKSAAEIFNSMNLSKMYEKFGRKREFETFSSDVRKWNFWSYVTRSVRTMGPIGARIHHQLRNYKRFVKTRMEKELAVAVAKRDKT